MRKHTQLNCLAHGRWDKITEWKAGGAWGAQENLPHLVSGMSAESPRHWTAVSLLTRSWVVIIADSLSWEISYKLQQVSPDHQKPSIFKDFSFGTSQMWRPPPVKCHVSAPELGGARTAQRKCHFFFFLTWLAIFFQKQLNCWLTFSKKFEHTPNLENSRLYG